MAGITELPGFRPAVLQAVLNFVWAPLFFGMKRLASAGVVALALAAAAAATAVEFYQAAGLAPALLFAPYVLWLLYAALLNARLWSLNRKLKEAPA